MAQPKQKIMTNEEQIQEKKHKLCPALCLDLDGTVRITKSGRPFAQSIDDHKLNGDIERIIWRYRLAGYLILGISNQGGVAWGFKKPLDVELEMQVLFSLFNKNPFHAVKYCYHDPSGSIEPYNHRSLYRKPSYGMLAECETDCWKFGYIIDWDKSLFVGDRPEDEQCAQNAGIKFHHIDDFLSQPYTFIIE